jgi:hypothetical protein
VARAGHGARAHALRAPRLHASAADMRGSVHLALLALLVCGVASAQDEPTTTTFPLPTTTTAESTTTTEPLASTTTTAASTTTTTSTATSTTAAVSTTTAPATTTSTLALPTTSSTSTTLVVPTTTLAPPTSTTLPPLPGPCAGGACDDGDPCTADDACVDGACVGVPVVCDDGIDCTVDRCVAGQCVATPSDRRCDTGGCLVRTCAPGAPGADRAGCVAVPAARDGVACTDDGFACTDDVCLAGRCLHVPAHGRCASPDACTTAACLPGTPGADASGCVDGEPLDDGAACPDDGDVCTADVCGGGGCRHDAVGGATCSPVQQVFDVANALASEARTLQGAAAEAGAPGAVIALRLDPVERAFAAAARALAGQPGAAPALAGTRADTEMTAAERARIAFTTVLRTPRQVSAFLSTVAEARARAGLSRPLARYLRRRGRVLRRTARFLKAELRDIARAAP